MENAPIVRFGAIRPNPEVRDRFDQWFNEVYYPQQVKIKGVTALDHYKILKVSGDYPETMAIFYLRSLKAYLDFNKDPLRAAIQNDLRATWIDKYGGERVWDGNYSLIKSFGKEPLMVRESDEVLSIQSPQVINIAGFRLSPVEAPKYAQWFAATGSVVYTTLFARMAGVRRIDCLEHTGIFSVTGPGSSKQDQYPPYVLVFHFDGLKACEDFEKSAELAAFHEGIKANFPGGLEYKWNVNYQLIKSFRK